MSAPNVLTAGEASGAQIIDTVLPHLVARHPELRWTGFGGAATAASASYVSLGAAAELGGAGLVEIIPALPRLLRARRRLVAALDAAPPVALFVDAPDLHLPLARRARAAGVRTAQLVSPQFWAWRPQRRDFMAEHLDLTLCLFDFEVPALRSAGAAAHFVGHPLVERLPAVAARPDRERPVVALLPGSRRSEVARHLEPFVRAARAAGGQTVDLVVPWRLDRAPPPIPGVRFDHRSGAEVLEGADAALVAAGTATLEAALLGVPTIVAVRLHPLSAAITRPLLRTPFVALPNVLLKREVLREHIQDLSGLGDDLATLLHDLGAARDAAAGWAGELREVMGPPGFASRVVDAVAPLLQA